MNSSTSSNIESKKEANILSLLKSQIKHASVNNEDSTIKNTMSEPIKQHNTKKIFTISYKNITIQAYDVTEKEKIVLKELVRFYNREKIEKIKPIINQEHDISLRLIDWTPTNYGKKNCIKYRLNNGKIIDVFESYKNYMTSYKRNILFDLFRRGKCLKLIYGTKDSEYIITSVKQLNSFRWVLEIELLDYISKNKEKIEADMRISLRRSAANKKNKSRKKRQELSSSIYKKCMKHYYKTTITF